MEKIGISHGAREASTGCSVCWASCGGPPPFLPSSLCPATSYIIVPKLPSSYHILSYKVGVDIVLNKICQEKVCLNI